MPGMDAVHTQIHNPRVVSRSSDEHHMDAVMLWHQATSQEEGPVETTTMHQPEPSEWEFGPT